MNSLSLSLSLSLSDLHRHVRHGPAPRSSSLPRNPHAGTASAGVETRKQTLWRRCRPCALQGALCVGGPLCAAASPCSITATHRGPPHMSRHTDVASPCSITATSPRVGAPERGTPLAAHVQRLSEARPLLHMYTCPHTRARARGAHTHEPAPPLLPHPFPSVTRHLSPVTCHPSRHPPLPLLNEAAPLPSPSPLITSIEAAPRQSTPRAHPFRRRARARTRPASVWRQILRLGA